LSYLWVAIGSALGGMGRYACSGIGVRFFGEAFPWGTLFVNVAGSLVIGALAFAVEADGRILAGDSRAFLMIGLCGGFTTFSAFSLEALNLARNGDWAAASGYVAGSVVLCLAAAAIGYFGAAALAR